MQGFLIWGAFTVAVAAFCVWRPHPARIFVGLFFGVMGLGVHGGLKVTNPQGYVDFAADAPWAIYRDIGTALTEPSPLAFGNVMLTFDTVTAALIPSRGRAVTWGLLAATLFLVGITPLGLEAVPNLILAAGIAFLFTQDFPTDVWTMLRRHRRPKLTPAAPRAASPRVHGSIPEMTTRPRQRAPRRSDVVLLPQARAESFGRSTGADRGHAECPPPPTLTTEAR